MPDQDVILSVETEKNQPQYHNIVAPAGEYYVIEVADRAMEGETVRATITVLEEIMKISSVTYNDNQCTYVSDDGTKFVYEFAMPDADVVLAVNMELDLHPITKRQGEHTTLSLLNCIYNPETPDETTQAYMGELVRYVVDVEFGYDMTQSVIGESGADIPYLYVPDDPEYGVCWRVSMPDEPITIQTAAAEKTDYAGKYFTGRYVGFELRKSDKHIFSGTQLPLTMELKENTVFTVSSSDPNAFDFDGCYAYDEAAETFTYVREFCKKNFGVSGKYLEGDIFIYIDNLLDNKPDYTKFYFTSNADFDYTCASDPHDQKFLLEIDKDAGKIFYYIDRETYSYHKVAVEFDEGSSLAGPSSAMVYLDGTPLFRYMLESSDASPVFTYRGDEAGTYTSSSGSGQTLTLDGFGKGSVGGAQGTYTVLGGIVTFTSAGTTTKYLIDLINKTYYEVKSDAAWDGASHYYGESDYGYNSDVSTTDWVRGYVHVYPDKDLMGNDKPRYASVRMYLPDRFGGQTQIISDCVPYIYDPQAGTLVLSRVAQGVHGGWGQERRDVPFTVSGDRQSITFATDYIYSMTTPNKYIYVSGLTLTAAQ